MKFFLKLKHWKLFALIVVLPVIIQLGTIGGFTITRNPFWLIIFFPISILVSLGSFFGWFYSLGVGLSGKLPDKAKMNLTFFEISLFLPMIYIFLFLCFIVNGAFSEKGEPVPNYLAFIIPIHLFMMFCMLYLLYFISKSLKAVELQKSVTFNDYRGEFFLIWLYPIGIWFIQPRVNEIFKNMK